MTKPFCIQVVLLPVITQVRRLSDTALDWNHP